MKKRKRKGKEDRGGLQKSKDGKIRKERGWEIVMGRNREERRRYGRRKGRWKKSIGNKNRVKDPERERGMEEAEDGRRYRKGGMVGYGG